MKIWAFGFLGAMFFEPLLGLVLGLSTHQIVYVTLSFMVAAIVCAILYVGDNLVHQHRICQGQRNGLLGWNGSAKSQP